VAEADVRPVVLVVDDEPMIRDVLQQFLTREGFEVLTASNGPEALALCRAQPGAGCANRLLFPCSQSAHVIASPPDTALAPRHGRSRLLTTQRVIARPFSLACDEVSHPAGDLLWNKENLNVPHR
jgi:CheY-like chemotaxis protein